MKKRFPIVFIIIIFIVGLTLVIYPSLSNWYNRQVSSYVVSDYKEALDTVDEEAYARMMEEAKAYNQKILENPKPFTIGEVQDEEYKNTLNVLNGMMGFVFIDDININLPIYHGTAESTLQKFVGHLEGTSLPTGEVGNHTVLTGHTGLPSAKLFTDLTKMELDDTFEVHVLNEEFVYKVFNIVVVEPQEVDALKPIAGKDVVTLVTCTPYGVNSHRLLVQGEQIDSSLVNESVVEEQTLTNDGFQEVDVNANNRKEGITDIIPAVVFILWFIIVVLFIILLVIRMKYSKALSKKKRKSSKGGYK